MSKKSYSYRYQYEKLFGSIPNNHDIHHIDGNRANNEPNNWKLVTLQEHYDIHKNQGDWNACYAIAIRMKVSPEEKSKLAKKAVAIQISQGKNVFKNSEWQRQNQIKRIQNKTHHLLKENGGSERAKKLVTEQLAKGIHNFQKQINPSFTVRTCPHCNFTGKGGSMKRWHLDNCKHK